MRRKIQSLCIVSPRYPTKENPVYTFVDELVSGFVDNEIDCNVISPYSLTEHVLKGTQKPPRIRERVTPKGNVIKIYTPRYMSFSKTVFNVNTAMATYVSFRNSVLREYTKQGLQADAIYGHFMYPAGMCVADLGELLGMPSFLAYGESSSSMYDYLDDSVLQMRLKKMNGVISVSSANKNELLERKLVSRAHSSKIGVFPNAIDKTKFFKLDKLAVRKQLGIENHKFVVAFVGHFIERKGVSVLSKALDSFNDVYSFFIGKGPKVPECKNIIFKGSVPHEDVHLYLNAADLFVLPTLAEGCCNAIVEAMACGLPIISSDRPFNADILNEDNSILIDPDSVHDCICAINALKDDSQRRNRLAEGAHVTAKDLSISSRVTAIVKFMEERMV